MAKKNTIDLTKLKEEINLRKAGKDTLVEGSTTTVAPADGFLNDLLISLNEGRPSPATNLIKLVENKTAEKNREKLTHTNVSETAVETKQAVPQVSKSRIMPESDNKFYDDINNMRKQTLAESMEKYVPPKDTQQSKTPTAQINESYLMEGVQKIVNTYLSESLAPILEETIKSTILELYAVERIKEVMQENSEIIKKVVYETIREIQSKSKKKAG